LAKQQNKYRDTIFESARISSKLICADLGLNPDWNGIDNWFSDVKLPKGRRLASRK